MDTKTGNMALMYGAVAVMSVLLLVCYLLWEKKKERRFTLLFACVATANVGYFMQAISHTLSGAMTANKISYLGAAYSMLIMLLIIMDVCQVPRRKWLGRFLFGISTAAFLQHPYRKHPSPNSAPAAAHLMRAASSVRAVEASYKSPDCMM